MSISIGGKVATQPSTSTNPRDSIAIGTAFLGFAIMGAGIRWWRKSENPQHDDKDIDANTATLDRLIVEIAKLDEEHKQGKLSSEAYQRLRQELMRRAKRLL